MNKTHYVYILSSDTGTLYTGVTSDLVRRMWEHKNGVVEGFPKKYNIHRLIYFEETLNVESAIEREKQIKSFRRSKKLALVRKQNPKFDDLADDWFD
jgi:putative endonuclease